MLITLIFVGCNPSFDPLQENEQYYFSINGYLDASADTQWVRVMPVRDSLLFTPRPIDASVTLEDVSSGETVTMNDSLFSYPQLTYAHNFWTTMDLHPGRTYRLSAENSEGKTSSAEVALPEDYPTPTVRLNQPTSSEFDRIYINGVKQLADASTIYRIRDFSTGDVQIIRRPHLQDTTVTFSGDYQVLVDPNEDPGYIMESFPDYEIVDRQIFLAAAGPGWINFATLDEILLRIPQGASNVDQGVGHLAGIVSKTIPYASCMTEDDALIPCPLETPPW